MAVFDMVEAFLVKKMKFKPTRLLRFSTRTLYVGELYRVYILIKILNLMIVIKHKIQESLFNLRIMQH